MYRPSCAPCGDPGELLSPFSYEWMAAVARTFDEVSAPVWIHDLSFRCIYRNRSTAAASPDEDGLQVHELLDHEGRTVGHLCTRID